MTPSELWLTLQSLGVELSLNADGGLHVEAPAGVLTPALRHELCEHKPEIMALLSRRVGIAPEAVAAIKEIEPVALSLGWTEAQL
ncbi:MAG TPA: hypothetical protein GXX51_01000 [Firmicutes bacterium]|nr:hypothetical protein [Bacillota bacterium]